MTASAKPTPKMRESGFTSHCCLVLLLTATVAPRGSKALTPSTEELHQDLIQLMSSSQNQDRAWAAYLIRTNRLTEFSLQLLGLLARGAEPGQAGSGALYGAILDSLIQLGIPVPAKLLIPIYDAFPNEATVLLAGSPDWDPSELLSLIRRQRSDEEWLAICNLLATARAPGFAAYLLSDIKLRVGLAVFSGENASGYGEGGAAFGQGCGMFQPPPSGFPPAVLYELTTTPRDGAVVVARGPQTVYYVRSRVDPRRQVWVGRSYGSRDQRRIEYLALMMGRPMEQLEFRATRFFSITWKGRKRFLSEAAGIRKRMEHSYRELIDALLKENLLTSSEAGNLRPDTSIVVHDFRKTRFPALPALR